MNRAQAMAVVAARLDPRVRVIIANGAMGREFVARTDSPRHLVLLGSMGLAASVGIGYALQRPEERVVVLDGDGNLFMGLGGLLLAGAVRPVNLLHLVVDNGSYATTGGQPTGSAAVDLPGMALAAGYAAARSVRDAAGLERELAQWTPGSGPVLLRVEVTAEKTPPAPRIPRSPVDMARRFRNTGKE